MLADNNNLAIEYGLKTLVNKFLIHISTKGEIWMHNLLKQMGRQVIHRQEPWKRRILVDAQQICDVLENETGTRVVSGISFDTSGINEVIIGNKALKRMPNLRFLKVYNGRYDVDERVEIIADLDYLPRLRLLEWEAYPGKCLPPTFHTECLVELNMKGSHLKKLWEGPQALPNLKKMDLSYSLELEELPDLSNATNLEVLELSDCESLVELPSSIANLHELKDIMMAACKNLQVIPAHLNLASLDRIDMSGFSRLKTFPDFSTNIMCLSLSDTNVVQVPASIKHWSHLYYIDIRGKNQQVIEVHLPGSIGRLDLSYSDIVEIPDCIKGLRWLKRLYLSGCTKLASLPELPNWLTHLKANNCESFERVTCPLNTPNAGLQFANCFKLDGEARRLIIKHPFLKGSAFLPGRVMLGEFIHRAKGSSLTIRPSSASFKFKACVILSHTHHQQHTRIYKDIDLRYRIIDKSRGSVYKEGYVFAYGYGSPRIQTEHMCIFHGDFPEEDTSFEVSNELVFEFHSKSDHPLNNFEIVECGLRIFTNEATDGCNTSGFGQVLEEDDDASYYFEPNEVLAEDDSNNTLNGILSSDLRLGRTSDEEEGGEDRKKHTYCWSWLFFCFDL